MKKDGKLLPFNQIKCVVKIWKMLYNESRGTKVSKLWDNYVLRLYMEFSRGREKSRYCTQSNKHIILKEDIRNVIR